MAPTMSVMNLKMLQASTRSSKRIIAPLLHIQPPPLVSTCVQSTCTAIAAHRQRRPKMILSGSSSVQFRPSGLSSERKFPSIVCKAVGGVATETLVDVEKVESSRETNVDAGKEPSDSNWKIKMLYDGDCPLCMREVNMLKERNQTYGTIAFVNIGTDDYSPEQNNGIDYETAMGRIHAICRDGTVLTNVAAFRALYEEVGLGWVYAITNHQPWASIADALYSFWAKYRLPVTGRPPLAVVLEKRRQKREKAEACDAAERCRID
ncbi:unnamed protein product [Sphagnum jensenii]|uniref:Thiol-disulfide oxidoreductase DCC n=1 Tax=Sphagnum jensenii TaxID=128206 RepID=A0ABP0VM70_9BRYO